MLSGFARASAPCRLAKKPTEVDRFFAKSGLSGLYIMAASSVNRRQHNAPAQRESCRFGCCGRPRASSRPPRCACCSLVGLSRKLRGSSLFPWRRRWPKARAWFASSRFLLCEVRMRSWLPTKTIVHTLAGRSIGCPTSSCLAARGICSAPGTVPTLRFTTACACAVPASGRA